MPTPQYEFASPDWFAALHALVHQAVETAGDLSDTEWSACEVFTGLPAHLPQGRDGTVAWHYYLKNGEVTFGFGERTDVKFRAVLDWSVARELAVVLVGGDPVVEQQMEQRIMQALEAGKAEIHGSREDRPEKLPNYHDPLARVTRL